MIFWEIDKTDVTTSQNKLVTDVLISLFTDRRALDSDELPTGKESDKRGWWADSFRQRKIGSRLWLLSREKQLNSVLKKAEEYAKESLNWLVEDKVIISFTVDAISQENSILMLNISITQNKHDAPIQLSMKANLNGV